LIPEYIIIASDKIFQANTDGTIETAEPCNKDDPVPCKEIKKFEKLQQQ
jgi:hypothetical protein